MVRNPFRREDRRKQFAGIVKGVMGALMPNVHGGQEVTAAGRQAVA